MMILYGFRPPLLRIGPREPRPPRPQGQQGQQPRAPRSRDHRAPGVVNTIFPKTSPS